MASVILWHPEGDERAYFLSMDEIADRVKEAWEIGATEVCMQGGMHPDIDGNFYIELIKAVKGSGSGDAYTCVFPV